MVATTPATPADTKESVACVTTETAHIESETVGKMTVECLKKELLFRGLDTNGKKTELVTKLKTTLETPLTTKKESGTGEGNQKSDDVCHSEVSVRKKTKVELPSDNLPDYHPEEYSLEYTVDVY